MTTQWATTFDANVWYGISETRVDNNSSKSLGSTLQTTNDGLRVFGLVGQSWQLQPVDNTDGHYLLRTSTAGPSSQLTACYVADEIHPSRTQACLKRTVSDSTQKWIITPWGDGTFKINNVGNGTGYVMDVHPGSAVFMSSEIEGVNGNTKQVAQHWVFSSRSLVNDGAYSTIYSDTVNTATRTPATTTASQTGTATTTPAGGGAAQTSTSAASSIETPPLSAAAAAGVAVGATAVFIALLGLLFFWWRRRRQGRQGRPLQRPVELPGVASSKGYGGGGIGSGGAYTDPHSSGANSNAGGYSPSATTATTWMGTVKGGHSPVYSERSAPQHHHLYGHLSPPHQQPPYQPPPVEADGNHVQLAELYTPHHHTDSSVYNSSVQNTPMQLRAGTWGAGGNKF